MMLSGMAFDRDQHDETAFLQGKTWQQHNTMQKTPKRMRPAAASDGLAVPAEHTPDHADMEASSQQEIQPTRCQRNADIQLAEPPPVPTPVSPNASTQSPEADKGCPSTDVLADGPASPSGNRARFMSGLQPTKVTCDLANAPASPGMRFSFEAIVVVVYPASASPPERRYIELMDAFGTTGITVWNTYVHVVTPASVGCVAKFTRLALTMHNGKKNLTMSKDSTMHLELPTYQGMHPTWWQGLLTQPVINCMQFHDTPALHIVNISGILGHVQQEEKMVKGSAKNLLVLYLTDRTGKIEIRSWNHSDTEFLPYKERPVLLKRVRVCLYAGTRTGELLTGLNGTTITTHFDNDDLKRYWSE
jgi:hypothetical protein